VVVSSGRHHAGEDGEGDVRHLTTVVMDESRSNESREFVAKMDPTDYFDIISRVDMRGCRSTRS
jgi:hypothetical protein